MAKDLLDVTMADLVEHHPINLVNSRFEFRFIMDVYFSLWVIKCDDHETEA